MQNGKVCLKCGKPKADSAFFKSSSSYHKDGLVPICRKCIIDTVYNPDTDAIDIGNFEEVLQKVDKPFLPKIMNAVDKQIRKQYSNKTGYERVKTAVGLYFKNINSLKQYQDTTYSSPESKSSKRQRTEDLVYYLSDDNFAVTEGMIRLFGEGYTEVEYQQMQKTYNCAMQDYPNFTHAQIRLLLRYVRYDAKEHSAMMKNDPDVDRWSKLASGALAQFVNACSKTNADNSFSALMEKMKQAESMEDVLPQFKYRPNDAPDFIIWCYVNYCRRLEGKPEVEYSDVYKFYDEKVAEYIKQYGDLGGIFEDDPTLSNRKNIEEFIKLPPDYYGDGE